MTGSRHWTTPSKNRYGNYGRMMKRTRTVTRAGANPIVVRPASCERGGVKRPVGTGGGMVAGWGPCACPVSPQFKLDGRIVIGATLAVALPRLAVALISLAIIAAFLLPIPLARAAAGGRISGRLLDGTKKNVPVVGQSVTLQMAQGNNARDVTSIKTDA